MTKIQKGMSTRLTEDEKNAIEKLKQLAKSSAYYTTNKATLLPSFLIEERPARCQKKEASVPFYVYSRFIPGSVAEIVHVGSLMKYVNTSQTHKESSQLLQALVVL